jgi:hypothetical protein
MARPRISGQHQQLFGIGELSPIEVFSATTIFTVSFSVRPLAVAD